MVKQNMHQIRIRVKIYWTGNDHPNPLLVYRVRKSIRTVQLAQSYRSLDHSGPTKKELLMPEVKPSHRPFRSQRFDR